MAALPSPAVLLIEDNPGDAELVAVYLRAADPAARLDHVDTLDEGLARLADGRYDVVLLDLSLPDSRGLDTLRRLGPRTLSAPVVILTGFGDQNLGVEAVREGAQDFVPKGELSSALLARVVRHAVGRFRVEEELREREARLRVLTEQVPAVLWTTDRDLRFTSSRGAGLARLNLRPDEVNGMTVCDYFRGASGTEPAVLAHARALLGESASVDLDWQGRTYVAHVEPLVARGQVEGTIGVALDITDTRKAEEEDRAARRIQWHLLPRGRPAVRNLEVGAVSVPATATGGDFLDSLGVTPDEMTVAVGDVAGHGFAAALLMATARAYVRALARLRPELADALGEFNRLFLADAPADRFVTLLLCRLDARAGTLVYASAGHTTGFVLDRDGRVRERLEATGLPAGVDADSRYAAAGPARLNPGEVLLLMTDGVVESECPDPGPTAGRQFGYQRALDIARLYRRAPAQEMAVSLFHAARAFARYEPQEDDISVVVVKVLDGGA
jgi:PAS domain S-box-containing protein